MKNLAGFAATAMLLSGGLVTGSPASAATPGNCEIVLRAPDGATASYIYVDVNWLYSSSRASVKPEYVDVYNHTGRSVTFTTNRWQNSTAKIVNHGSSGQIEKEGYIRWLPSTWIRRDQKPYVSVSMHATTRPGMNGSCKVYPPIPS